MPNVCSNVSVSEREDHFQNGCSLVPRKFAFLGTVREESQSLREVSNTAEQAATEQVNCNGNDVVLKFYIGAQSNIKIRKTKVKLRKK